MFNFTEHGPIAAHQYRGFYDSTPSETHCAFCNRRIRFCYAIHDQNHRTFIIGSCDFYHYKGTSVYRELRAAQVLQRSYLRQRLLDTASYRIRGEIKAAQRAWTKARRRAFFRLMKYRNQHGTWLPKPLFDLEQAAKRVPGAYKRQTLAIRWYVNQAQKIETLISGASI